MYTPSTTTNKCRGIYSRTKENSVSITTSGDSELCIKLLYDDLISLRDSEFPFHSV